ncbi:hypothetical protein BCR35DRAFT_284118 [Leucosporidium creatinivorum]|uniref:Peptide hydrolase n=1 Tax=Leucosporidium creatinivorum TaxID=106004 RepID=A0A1Y2DBQ5_9BASI|nr:hypothetical protein BCR35DRAFT_284118 [Leucosporidium creatinivorum]
MHLAAPALLALSASLSLVSALPAQQQLTFAQPVSLSSILPSLQLPACHLRQLEQHIARFPETRRVRLEDNAEPLEITEGEKALLVLQGKRFIDVTEEESLLLLQEKQTFPSKLTYTSKALDFLFQDIDLKEMKTFLTAFSSFRTRYYRSETGKQSQQFLLKTLKDIAKTNPKLPITITEFPHPWGQNSIIVRFEPEATVAGNKTSDEIVILGAHQDSTNLLPFLAAPGADDDGSGTTTLVSAFTALVKHSFIPSRNPVEFIFASAEEGGLLGSQAVAQSYAKEGKKVRSMLQMDMTSVVKEGTKPTIGLIRDFVDPEWTEHVALIIDEYSEIGYTDTECGYACSDHASWTKIGAPSAFTIESTFADSSKAIHSSSDTISQPGFSFEHMAQFTRISIAMAVEMGGGEGLKKLRA